VNSERTFVGHVLAVETEQSGVILVDTGIGAAARANPERILGRGFTTMFRPNLDPDRSARRQLERLGLADEVQHVIVTHLDVDHAGGLSDFPGATVHVHRDELAAATRPGSLNERLRYRSILWDHVPRFEPFGPSGEAWFGFEAARQLRGLPDDLVAIPLPGHTRGHVAVAVAVALRGCLFPPWRHPPGQRRSGGEPSLRTGRRRGLEAGAAESRATDRAG
jgi:glyoxylase-like metal-dependent hydrolase (beta-lactamase superfamily II)